MAKITGIIGVSYFEQIRDRIGAILFTEIENQLLLTGNYEIDATIFTERATPPDASECPMIIISLASGTYDNKSQGYVRGSYDFYVDVYTAARSSALNGGDRISTTKLHRLLAICRSILENPVYKTLDFSAPGIMHTECTSINIRSNQSMDALNTSMGRLLFKVTAGETTTLLTAPDIADYYTTIKLALTDEGYKYEKEEIIV